MLATMAVLAPPVAIAASTAARTTIRWPIARLMSMMSKRLSRARSKGYSLMLFPLIERQPPRVVIG